jgi:hypothetical protein
VVGYVDLIGCGSGWLGSGPSLTSAKITARYYLILDPV